MSLKNLFWFYKEPFKPRFFKEPFPEIVLQITYKGVSKNTWFFKEPFLVSQRTFHTRII